MTTPIVCATCLRSLGASPNGDYCPGCGTRLGPAQRSTGRMRALAAGGDGTRLAAELDASWGRLRARADAPDALLDEGRELADQARRWDLIDGPTRVRVLTDATAWTRAVGVFLTGGA